MNLQLARTITEAILNELEIRKKAAVVAVCDASGELVSLARADNSPFTSIGISMNKAYTAARDKKESGEIGRQIREKELGDIAFYGDRRITGFGGGLPVYDQTGRVIGGVGVSGLSEEEDIELGRIGLSAIQD